jgi:hypothetical protein
MEDVLLFIAKAYMPIFVVYKISGWSIWSCIKILELCLWTTSKWFNMPSCHWWLKPWIHVL